MDDIFNRWMDAQVSIRMCMDWFVSPGKNKQTRSVFCHAVLLQAHWKKRHFGSSYGRLESVGHFENTIHPSVMTAIMPSLFQATTAPTTSLPRHAQQEPTTTRQAWTMLLSALIVRPATTARVLETSTLQVSIVIMSPVTKLFIVYLSYYCHINQSLQVSIAIMSPVTKLFIVWGYYCHINPTGQHSYYAPCNKVIHSLRLLLPSIVIMPPVTKLFIVYLSYYCHINPTGQHIYYAPCNKVIHSLFEVITATSTSPYRSA